jgi:4-amino-4-deoxychorismate lyase
VSVGLYRGNARIEAIDPASRGIAYGDGLFETMRVHAGRVPWWQRHWARLVAGAGRLCIPLPDPAFAAAEADRMLEGRGVGVLKLVVSRGVGGRGYAPASDADADWQLALHPLPPAEDSSGLVLRWCRLRLAHQPLLAGLKHCNRLEQVLARAEWREADARERGAHEGLLCDQAGHVVCATAANLFVLQGGRWRTPVLDACGVAGICRQWAIDALDAEQARLAPADVESADAVFLCNAVRGILPVARLGGRSWPPHPALARAMRLLAGAHPAFATEQS